MHTHVCLDNSVRVAIPTIGLHRQIFSKVDVVPVKTLSDISMGILYKNDLSFTRERIIRRYARTA